MSGANAGLSQTAVTKFTKHINGLVMWLAGLIKWPLQWLQHRLPQAWFMVVLAVLVGLFSGIGAHLLKVFVKWISRWLTHGIDMTGPNWILIVLPVIGIVLAGIYQRYVLHRRIEHGTEQLKRDLSKKNYWLSPELLYAPITATSVTLGFGGSAGSEGPIAYTGAAIGSNVARACGLPPRLMMIMIGCGAGAGIAGIFKSPIGGMLFTLEVMRIELTSFAVMALLVTCIVAALTAYMLSGGTPDVTFIPAEQFDMNIVPAVLLLGLFCGLYGYYYSATAKYTRLFLERLTNPWIQNLTSGLMLGVLVFLFPVLYGEGYGVLGDVINNSHPNLVNSGLFYGAMGHPWLIVAVVSGILLCKGIAATLTNSGGGVAGDFAPTLFAGCMAGFLFASVGNHLFGLHLCTQTFALIGMAATMSAIIKAPLMAIFITAEMTWNYEFFLPLVLASVVAYFTVLMLSSGMRNPFLSSNS